MTGTCNYDSILTATDSNFITTSEYYLKGDRIFSDTIDMAERAYSASVDSYLMMLLLLVLGTISMIVYRSRTSIAYHFQQFFREKRNFSLEGVNTKSFWIGSVVLVLILYLSVSLVLFRHAACCYEFNDVMGIPYWSIAVCLALFTLFFLFKLSLYSIVNWTFFPSESSVRWLSGYIFISSVFVFPIYLLTVLDYYSAISSTVVLYAYIILLFLYETLLIFKLFINFRLKRSGILPIFLYLCSVEFIPALIVWKILLWASNDIIEKCILY